MIWKKSSSKHHVGWCYRCRSRNNRRRRRRSSSLCRRRGRGRRRRCEDRIIYTLVAKQLSDNH